MAYTADFSVFALLLYLFQIFFEKNLKYDLNLQV